MYININFYNDFSNIFQLSFGNIMDQPKTRRSKPHENRSQFNNGSSAQATDETMRL